MATDQGMGIDERYQCLRRMQERYQQEDRRRRSQMLDAMIIYTGMHRKALIRRLGSDLTRKPRLRERGRTYGPEGDAATGLREAIRDALEVVEVEEEDSLCVVIGGGGRVIQVVGLEFVGRGCGRPLGLGLSGLRASGFGTKALSPCGRSVRGRCVRRT